MLSRADLVSGHPTGWPVGNIIYTIKGVSSSSLHHKIEIYIYIIYQFVVRFMYFIFYVSVSPVCMCVCNTCMFGALKGQKRSSDPQDLKLGMIVDHLPGG